MSISRSGWAGAWILGLALVGCGKETAEPSCCTPPSGGAPPGGAPAASGGFAAGAGGSGAIAGGGTTSGLDPVQTPDGLCQKWAESACNAAVVTNCGAANAAACVARQKQFCLGLLASKGLDGPFVLAKANACLDAVKTAYATAALTAAAKTTVLSLGYPCDTLEQAGTDAGSDGGCGAAVCRTGGQTCGGADEACVPGTISPSRQWRTGCRMAAPSRMPLTDRLR